MCYRDTCAPCAGAHHVLMQWTAALGSMPADLASRGAAGLHDTRVPYWAPAKWAAATRAAATNGPLILLRTSLAAGHFGPSGFAHAQNETAFRYAWLLRMTCWPGGPQLGLGAGSRQGARAPGAACGPGCQAALWCAGVLALGAAGLWLWRVRARRRLAGAAAAGVVQMQAVGRGAGGAEREERERLVAGPDRS